MAPPYGRAGAAVIGPMANLAAAGMALGYVSGR
jgi:hypothetical protein